MKKKLIAVCTLLGIQFANEADDAATETALDQVHAKVTGFANTLNSIKTKLGSICTAAGITFANDADDAAVATAFDQLGGKVTALNTELGTARTSLQTAQTQFANERTERINDELALGVTSGRITAADRPTWETRLKVDAQFANERTALRALKPVVKTTSVTVTRSGREQQIDVSDTRARTQFVNEVCAEVATELKLNPVRDSKRIMGVVQQRHPALFENIPHVEIKMPGGKAA